MKVTVLGSGTSTGVPRIGDDWGFCDPSEPRNRRTRVSAVLQNDDGKRLLIDTSPDLRTQLLANDIDWIDGVVWTHDHADHCHGIDDLRVLRYSRSAPIPGFASPPTTHRLRQRFGYVFAGQYGYPTIVQLEPLNGRQLVAGYALDWCQMPHGPIESTGFRIEADGAAVGYATDFSAVTPEMLELFEGVDLLLADCLRRTPHPSHAHLDLTLEFAERVGAGRTVLIHLDKSMDYRTLAGQLPERVSPGYDGLELVA